MFLSKKEEKILKSIIVRSENDPNNPEFPDLDPKFPATPTYKINIEGFSNIYLKDESYNPTGTHKDRLAWEIIVYYRDFLLAKKRGQLKESLPHMSIISSGSAANAIQKALKRYELPSLKVLVDLNINKNIYKSLESIGCEMYREDLSSKILYRNDILTITENKDGFDITSGNELNPTTRFYDWLSYEIINSSPDYCFIPFGTGNLYENVLNINRKELSSKNHDPRFKGKISTLRNCVFIGATTKDKKSKAEKLYSPHLPFSHFDNQWIRFYRNAGYCGFGSDVYLLKENFLDEAAIIAKEQNIDFEYSGIAGLAMFLQMKDEIPKNKKILIVNTGKTKYM